MNSSEPHSFDWQKKRFLLLDYQLQLLLEQGLALDEIQQNLCLFEKRAKFLMGAT